MGERELTLLHVFPSFARGGQQTRLAAIAASGAGGRFCHRIISLDDDLSAQEAFTGGNVTFEVFPLKKSPTISLTNVDALRRRIRESKADLLCTYNFGALEAAIANRFGPKLPHIHYEDGFGPDETVDRQKGRRVLTRRLLLGRSFVVVPSRTLEKAALKTWRLKRKRLRRIANGVDATRFRPIAREKPIDAPLVIGALGALRAEKNFVRLINAFSAIDAADARLVIYGDGPERGLLSEIAASRSDRILLPGATGIPEKAYAEFDIFALSSDTEQAPLTLMEAMAAGLPVAAPDVGDIRDLVSSENRAFITAVGDEAALSGALRRLISDPALRARLGATNAARARELFDFAPMIAAHEALFEEAISRSRK